MKSRVFRDPVGLVTSQYALREGSQIASVWHTDGDNVYSSFSDATENRIPEITCVNPSPYVSTGGTGREHKESVRRTERSLFPVRQESKRIGTKTYEGSSEESSQCWSSSSICSGRRKSISDSVFQTEERSEESGREANTGDHRIDQKSGPLRDSEAKTKECFIDQNRYCTNLCAAYSIHKDFKEPCRILRLVDKLIPDPRNNRPTPPAPKIVK